MIANEFDLDTGQFKAIVEGFKAECDHGLNTTSASGLATMIPSYVTRMPTGQETGTFLALDLGGSNLRVSAVELLGNGQVNVVREIRKTVSDIQRTGPSTDFFDWLADAVGELLSTLAPHQSSNGTSDSSKYSRQNEPEKQRPVAMGVCWSFPLDQTDICQGKILRMGKGFTLDDVDGQDLAGLFHAAFKRKDINATVTALLNDTVGTLVAHAYSNPGACVGFIHGTGVNAAYPEKRSRIVKLSSSSSEGAAETTDIMLVNTEIDIFGSTAYLPLTRFDKALDAHHSQPGFQPYEKMMSGGYLGELARLIAMELIIDHQYLFDGNLPERLRQPWSFTTATMSDLEKLETNEEKLARFGEWLETDCINDYVPTIEDMRILSRICRIVSSRAASLAGAGIAAIIEHQNIITASDGPIIVGVNGSTFEKYPHMAERVEAAIHTWFDDRVSQRIRLGVARDGGSIGGALVAMLYSSNDKW
ncbi:hypothetical protein BDB00DRAFT_766126 [Zychaea mexicana]|uniref:uncharacterized protein n=1 Tax=Zychaea mexicana TaxID=64656 RepID=UPI0022FDD0FB|nr:uncharacterized protein BDB00DRAFT_766126 [Zychaea mexicana]KAI9491982.1 hypothetical protein BDB00DRAFT_766126 [Zychaea mexicana]